MAVEIFLDYHSTTPVDPRVVNVMLPFFTQHFANPHSSEHNAGLQAARAVETARATLARMIGARRADNIVFTSGATESNNLALRGIAANKKGQFLSSPLEHSSIQATLSGLASEGLVTRHVSIHHDGRVDLAALEAAIGSKTTLVSIQAANGEIGTIQDVRAIGLLCRERSVLFHTDAVQAFGHIAIDVERDGIDLMSLSAHKLHGPKGIGALYVSERARPLLRPQITGGGQQGGLRAGTVPTPLVVGFARATELMCDEGAEHDRRIAAMRDQLLALLRERVGGISVNGSLAERLPGNLNVCIEGIDADSLLLMLPDIALSTGSACSSGALSASPTLLALGLSSTQAASALRFGLARTTTLDQVEAAVTQIAAAVGRLRA